MGKCRHCDIKENHDNEIVEKRTKLSNKIHTKNDESHPQSPFFMDYFIEATDDHEYELINAVNNHSEFAIKSKQMMYSKPSSKLEIK